MSLKLRGNVRKRKFLFPAREHNEDRDWIWLMGESIRIEPREGKEESRTAPFKKAKGAAPKIVSPH